MWTSDLRSSVRLIASKAHWLVRNQSEIDFQGRQLFRGSLGWKSRIRGPFLSNSYRLIKNKPEIDLELISPSEIVSVEKYGFATHFRQDSIRLVSNDRILIIAESDSGKGVCGEVQLFLGLYNSRSYERERFHLDLTHTKYGLG